MNVKAASHRRQEFIMVSSWQKFTTRLQRLPGAQYVTVYLIFGLIISVVGLRIFTHTLEEVQEDDSIVTLETALANELHQEATPAMTSFYIAVSWLGSQGITVLAVIVAAYYLWRRQWLNLTFWIIALAGGG